MMAVSSKLNVLLVDDEPIWRENLKESLGMFEYVNVVGQASNGTEAIGILNSNKVDLVFLDIEMNGISGFQLAKHIQSAYPDIMIIFLTGHVDFAIDGYEYKPVDFLMKPVNILRLEQALLRVRNMKNTASKKDTRIGLHVDGGLEIVSVRDILYMEKSGRKVYIVCKNGSKYNSSDSMQKLQEIFEKHDFFRCHQSFLIPVDNIKSILLDDFKNSYNIQLANVKESIPLSRDRYNDLKELLIKKGMKIF
jgi:DNA-binding LytR/AlgR family response regulator